MRYLVEVYRDSRHDLSENSENLMSKYYRNLSWGQVEYATLETYTTLKKIEHACETFHLSYVIGRGKQFLKGQDGTDIFTLFHVGGDEILGQLNLHCRGEHVCLFSGERNRHEFLVSVLKAGGIVDIEPVEYARAYSDDLEKLYGK